MYVKYLHALEFLFCEIGLLKSLKVWDPISISIHITDHISAILFDNRYDYIYIPFPKFIYYWSISQCPKPVIAAVHSACVGGGVDLICSADIRYCTSDSWFQVKEVELGKYARVLI